MIDFERLRLEQVAPEQIEAAARQVGHRSHEVLERWRTKAEHDTLVMFAIVDGDTAVASINIILDGADEAAVVAEIGAVPMLNALGVNEPYRRHGLADRLLRQCETYVREHPGLPQRLALGVEPDNERARALYEKMGYGYVPVTGQELFLTTWPEFDADGIRYMYETHCLLMLKELAG